MKKVLAIALGLALVAFVFVGCPKPVEPTPDVDTTIEVPEVPVEVDTTVVEEGEETEESVEEVTE